jgi:Domain of unknown function (DUF4158)
VGDGGGAGRRSRGVLTDQQETSYGCFASEPTDKQPARYFYLDGEDKRLVARRCGDHNWLGFALQPVTARFLGTFSKIHLLHWLYGRTGLSAQRPSVLFDPAIARLVERKILLPILRAGDRAIRVLSFHARASLCRTASCCGCIQVFTGW